MMPMILLLPSTVTPMTTLSGWGLFASAVRKSRSSHSSSFMVALLLIVRCRLLFEFFVNGEETCQSSLIYSQCSGDMAPLHQ